MSDQNFVRGWLDVLREAVEGGEPGRPTGFLDGTAADGSGNHGLLATLAALSAEQASAITALGTSVAGQAAHTAYHMEVTVRWARDGDRGPFDWKGSFSPATVDADGWRALQERLRAAYADVRALAQGTGDWTEDAAGGMAATLAHVSYHLGAIRQLVKLT